MGRKKRCNNCRYYQPAPLRGQGWCRNPLLRMEHERVLVEDSALACDKRFYDNWEAASESRSDPTSSWLSASAIAGALLLVVAALGAVGYFYFGSPAPQTAALVQPTATATSTPLPPTPTETPTPTPALSETVRIANTGGDGAYIRAEPRTGSKGIIAYPDGTRLTVVGEDKKEASGRLWRNVRDSRGNEGWVPAEYLETVEPTPTEAEASPEVALPTPVSTPATPEQGATASPTQSTVETPSPEAGTPSPVATATP